MTYLLDTSICVHWLRGQYNVDKAIDRVGIDNCRISEITAAELLAGAISAGAVLVSENSPTCSASTESALKTGYPADIFRKSVLLPKK